MSENTAITLDMGGHTCGGVAHLVLHRGEEDLRFLFGLNVVDGKRENLADALVDTFLACPDFPDADK